MFRMKTENNLFQLTTIALLTMGMVGLFAALPIPQADSPFHPHEISAPFLLQTFSPKAAIAQRFDVDGVWQLVYQELPDFPLENQYISRSTGEAAENNTLVGRLIRYHVYVRGRPPIYRLDWKITLADYLGVNEPITPSLYPSADVLQTNPLEGDIAAVRALNRSQREALVQTLVEIFSVAFTPTDSSPSESEPPPSSPSAPDATPRIREPQPGDADLLLP
jgi:hypothetical protein